jgi:tRNA(Ile)-lysidine synthase
MQRLFVRKIIIFILMVFLSKGKSLRTGILFPKRNLLRNVRKLHVTTENNILHQVESSVRNSLIQHCGVAQGSIILLSVSGGLDSMSMMHIMHSISTTLLPLRLEVVSFNHKLRAESDAEIAFVRSYAEKYAMKFYERVLPEDQRGSTGLQARARSWRRSECTKILQNHPHRQEVVKCGGQVYYATAHHADDQIETVLLKLLRGSSISSLQGVRNKA